MDEQRFLLLVVSSLFVVCSSIPSPNLAARWTFFTLLSGNNKASSWKESNPLSTSPHTTHITQPLVRGCFAPLKVAWRQACHEFVVKNPGRVVTRYEFCQLFPSRATRQWPCQISFPVSRLLEFALLTNQWFRHQVWKERNFPFSNQRVWHKDLAWHIFIPLYSPARASSLKGSTPSKFQNVHPSRGFQQSPLNFS